ncbi:predicted protein [Uncinocarpus reesii 1704]|uniref:Cytochrome P450 n=1 Tax=Uncinocarpus reesii (strain UAMH 1704) TaxID=336963 RepID=C4JZQ8_UNCRE|nr:uncharacterized protein UREG_07659 [Uncinocarpus reesii 1704]EEP82794.1 predicted protein [Uncinocarpus reesii 1704]
MALLSTLVQLLAPLSIVFICISLGRALFRPAQSTLWSQPVVGLRKQWAAWLRATLRSSYNIKQLVFEGYTKYGSAGSAFVVPSIDRGPIMLIPPREVKRIYTLPESALDVRATQQETNQTRWVTWDKKPAEDSFVFDVIRQQVTRNLKHLTPVIGSEIQLGFERCWGAETEWKEIKIWDTCWQIVTGAVNSALCGMPLCRDPEFLKGCQDHSLVIMAGAMAINASHSLLQPITGGLIWLTCNVFFKRTLKKCMPVVKERLEKTAKLKTDPTYDWTPPKDAIQWIIDECYDTGNLARLDPKSICFRLLLLNDVSIPSTSFSVQSFIVDLFTADPTRGFVEALRKESEAAFEESGGIWTVDAVKKLKLVESAIRESMRLSPLGSIALPRTVISAPPVPPFPLCYRRAPGAHARHI